MGRDEIERFLAMLANERQVAAAAHNQALSALLSLYREVWGSKLPWLNALQRPHTPKTHSFGVDEGTGMRLMESMERPTRRMP